MNRYGATAYVISHLAGILPTPATGDPPEGAYGE